MARASSTTLVRAQLRGLRPGRALIFPVPADLSPRQWLIRCSAVAGQVLGSGRYRARTMAQGIAVEHLPAGTKAERAGGGQRNLREDHAGDGDAALTR